MPQLAHFYRPPSDPGLVARTADHVVLTQLDEPARDDLRRRGYRGPVLQYIRAEAIMEPVDGGPWHNQVAYQDGDWDQITTEHPDWFLLDGDGRRIRVGDGDLGERHSYLMDPAHPGWRRFFVDRARAMQARGQWDGILLDNIEVSLAKRERGGQIPARYPTDEAYAAAVLDFLAYVKAEVGVPVEANIIEKRQSLDPVWHQAAGLVDGALWEGWGVGWDHGRLLAPAAWQDELTQIETAQAAGTPVTVVAMGPPTDQDRERFAYASYLLATDGTSRFRYTTPDAYDQARHSPLYDIAVGDPVGPRTQTDDGGWTRTFTQAVVTVHPGTGQASITPRS